MLESITFVLPCWNVLLLIASEYLSFSPEIRTQYWSFCPKLSQPRLGRLTVIVHQLPRHLCLKYLLLHSPPLLLWVMLLEELPFVFHTSSSFLPVAILASRVTSQCFWFAVATLRDPTYLTLRFLTASYYPPCNILLHLRLQCAIHNKFALARLRISRPKIPSHEISTCLSTVVNDRGRGTLLYNWKFWIFVLVNHVVIGHIILMVSVRALVFLYSHGKAWETSVSI